MHSQPSTKKLSTALVPFLARQKFRFDLGMSVVNLITFAAAVISASRHIGDTLSVDPKIITAIIIPVGLLAGWFCGLTLDKMRFPHAYQDEQNHRNAMLQALANAERGRTP